MGYSVWHRLLANRLVRLHQALPPGNGLPTAAALHTLCPSLRLSWPCIAWFQVCPAGPSGWRLVTSSQAVTSVPLFVHVGLLAVAVNPNGERQHQSWVQSTPSYISIAGKPILCKVCGSWLPCCWLRGMCHQSSKISMSLVACLCCWMMGLPMHPVACGPTDGAAAGGLWGSRDVFAG
jgi:hypothetical protein